MSNNYRTYAINDIDYINLLIADSNVFTCTEAARYYPNVANAPSHDAFTRCLQRQPQDTKSLWEEKRMSFPYKVIK
nr:hypothetical protein [Methanosarcina barkeri]